MADRNIYLRTVPAAEAVERAKAALDRDALMAEEPVPSQEAAGRVLAEPVFARCSSPTYHAAAMDGIAVVAEDTFAAREGSPVTLAPGGFDWVNTGQPLPTGRDAVVMVEHVETDGESVRLQAPAYPWQHVRRIGEDIVATELLLPRHTRLTPYDVGALLSAGVWEVPCIERVRLTFIPTGDEVLDFRTRPQPGPGQVVESNSQVFAALARAWGAEATCLPPVADDADALQAAAEHALADGAHVVVLGAGSSAGSKDYTKAVFERLGEVLVHGIAVMPGKPTLLGAAEGRLLVGAPGYPVSSVVCFEDVLAPVVHWLGRRPAPRRRTATVALARKTPSKPGMEEVLRLAVGRVGNELVAAPLGRGAGLLTTLTKAQAITRIPPGSEGIARGERVTAELLVEDEDLDRVLVHVGSHDNTLDLLADALMALDEPMKLVSSHVGSMGGLTALRDGAALVAGCHLFDPARGDFNFPFFKRALGDAEVVVRNLAIRHQGLMVPKGNPKSIRGIADLARDDVRFVNRQRGAGTRILLDHHLKRAGVSPDDVDGYEREEYTHMGVAVNVLTGAADCGLGISAAATALGLDFVPLARERYDLACRAENAEDPRILALAALLDDPAFQERIRSLGGYETTLTGRVMAPGMGLGMGPG